MLPLLSPAHLDRDFDYLVPPELDEIAQPGVRVRVRFAGRLVDGYLLARLAHTNHTGKLVKLDRVVSPERVLTPEILRLATNLAARYAGTRADVLRLAIPPRHARTETGGSKKSAKSAPAQDDSAASPEASTTGGAADVVAIDPAALVLDSPTSVGGDLPNHPDDAGPIEPTTDSPAPEPDSDETPVSGPRGPVSGGSIRPAVPTGSGGSSGSDAVAGTPNVNPGGESSTAASGRPPVGDGDVAASGSGRSEGASEGRAVPAVADSESAEPAGRIDSGRVEAVVSAGVHGAGASDKGRPENSAVGAVPDSGSAESAGRIDSGRVEAVASPGVHDAGAPDSDSDGPASSAVVAVSDSEAAGRADSEEAAASGGVHGVEVRAWERYVHGVAFVGALGEGKGVRAGWQALPGEEWARRLAELAAVVVGAGRSAILMVPDQRDLDRVLAECVRLVGDSAVGLSAGLGPAARYRRWLAVLRGSARVVVGTRSAVFAPAADLGLIAIWDDGDDTYAEPRAPYPHAREVAMLRAYETGAAFVAAGFARTAEVQAVVDSGWAHDLIADRALLRKVAPRISAPGDTDIALERDPVARAVRIPGVAFAAARAALKEGAAVLVQVPRRGYVPSLACAKCRTPARCRHCNGPLALPDGGPRRSDAGSLGSGAAPGNRPGPEGGGRSGRPGSEGGGRPDGGHGPVGGGRSGGRSGADSVGFASARRGAGDVAQSPSCRWCGITEAGFRCPTCASRALRAVVIGAARTAEELGRAFPGVPIRGSGGGAMLDTVEPGPQVVVATVGAEPVLPGGYGVALLLDGWALLSRADLRTAEDALRRWMSAATLVRTHGQVIVMAEPSSPTVQALVRWDPIGHARAEVAGRAEVGFPPAVRMAAIDGAAEAITELLSTATLPDGVDVLGPVPLPPGARKPFAGDSPVEVERMLLRVDRSQGAALSRALTAAQAIRSTHRSDAPLRVQIDPVDIG